MRPAGERDGARWLLLHRWRLQRQALPGNLREGRARGLAPPACDNPSGRYQGNGHAARRHRHPARQARSCGSSTASPGSCWHSSSPGSRTQSQRRSDRAERGRISPEFHYSKIYRIPAARLKEPQPGVQRLPVFLDFRGTSFPVEEGSANGIAATSDGQVPLVTHFGAGRLYRVRLSDGQVRRIHLHGQNWPVPTGSP